jgi:NADP-dependent alcohol dehydrogenase
MNNFDFKNPTKILFGKGKIATISKEIPQGAKVLVLYGGGSIKKNGIYEQVMEALSGFEVEEFGGIPANPEYEVLIDALKVIKEKNIDFLLAVGGGSVIDGVKFLSAAVNYDGDEPWEILTKHIRTNELLEKKRKKNWQWADQACSQFSLCLTQVWWLQFLKDKLPMA